MIVIAALGPVTVAVAAEEASVIELAAPRPLLRGDAIRLQITTGPLPRGARLAVATEHGEILGAVYAFGQMPGRGSTATIPVPRSALLDGRLRVRLQVVEPGGQSRPPGPEEVERLDLVLVPHGE
jgi:hypothetical protein